MDRNLSQPHPVLPLAAPGTADAPDFTVLVATRNRAASLSSLLTRLAEQDTRGRFTYEVLIADNGSTDATRGVVDERVPSYPVPLRYIYEPRAGKPWALNAGMRHARGAILAFTDDDTVPEPSWLHALWTCFDEEEADAVTGRILPEWRAARPAWLTDEAFWTIGSQGCIDHGERRLHTLNGAYCRWVGGNVAIRREAAQRLGDYDSRMVRVQDTEYYLRAVRCGLAVVYEPTAVVYHQIHGERLTASYYRRWQHRTAYYSAYLVPWKKTHLLTIVPVWYYRRILRNAARWLGATCRRQPSWQRFRWELLVRYDVSLWWHRCRLWPRWWWTILTRRPCTPGR